MDKGDTETLELCLQHPHPSHNQPVMNRIKQLRSVWYAGEDTVLSVARILVQEGYLNTPSLVIDFFEDPPKWEKEMREIINYSREEISSEL